MKLFQGYVNTPVNRAYYHKVADGHELYVEECGNPQGSPVIFLHGGPGGSISEKSRRFFNPDKYHIVLFDQRGTGQSKPFLSLENNTPAASVSDIESLRQELGWDSFILFGGSYGSTLALAYAIEYPQYIEHLVLRGIFLGRQSDIDWLFQEGASYFYPDAFDRFRNVIDAEHRDQIVNSYYQMMTSGDLEARDQACKAWNDWESALVHHLPQLVDYDVAVSQGDLSLGLLEAHYFANHMFWDDDNYLLNHSHRYCDIPTDIVHGRYDVDCRLSGAYELSQHLKQSQLHIVEAAGHSPYEEAMMTKLVEIMDSLVE